jgi:hypothetical protein
LAYRGGDEDYAEYIKPQAPLLKLSRTGFAQQHRLVRRLLPDATAVRTVLWGALCNDLGKLDSVKKLYENVVSPKATDHDRCLGALLKQVPERFAAFAQLPAEARADLSTGFLSGSDIAQFVQMELPARGLAGLTQLSPQALDIYMLHSVMDVGGAAWHVEPRGSAVMTEGTWSTFQEAISSLSLFKHGATVAGVYTDYAARRAAMANISVGGLDQPALQCLAAMARSTTPEDGVCLVTAWHALPSGDRAILVEELASFYTPHGKEPIFVGYAPAMFANAVSAPALGGKRDVGMRIAMRAIARVFRYVRRLIESNKVRDRLPNGIFLAAAQGIAAALRADPEGALTRSIVHDAPGYGARLHLKA